MTPKAAQGTLSTPDRFSSASLTSLIPGQMVKPCIFEGGRLRAGSAPLLFSQGIPLASPPAWEPRVSDMSVLSAAEQAPAGPEREEDSGTGLLGGGQPHLQTPPPSLTASVSLFLHPPPSALCPRRAKHQR